MKNKTGKIFSRAAALLLGVALIAGNVSMETAFALTEEKKVDASFESYYDETE